jgi:hypothetical protein
MKAKYLKTISKDRLRIIWKYTDNDWWPIWNSSRGSLNRDNTVPMKRLLFIFPEKDWCDSKKEITEQEAFLEML